MSRIVKLVGAGIGLASEAYKANSNSRRQSSSQLPEYAEVTDAQASELISRGQAVDIDPSEAEYVRQRYQDIHEDEEIWTLDDFVGPGSGGEDGEPTKEPKAVADEFLRAHPPPPRPILTGQLPCPVIIPQRRPKDKKRGFVRAYAPILANNAIDQETFLEFLEAFHQASKADGWLQVVNMAALVAGMVPSVTAMATSAAVAVAANVAMEGQRRTRTNAFLDTMNKHFFTPRGLYCVIMTYKPESDDKVGPVNLLGSITSSIPNPFSSGSNSSSGWGQKLRASSGETVGELELPEAAPLVFPALDNLSSEEKNKMQRSGAFIADYFDRRAQATYKTENPGSSLAQTDPKFSSRFADPNHPANNGRLISLVTGGAINTRGADGKAKLGGNGGLLAGKAGGGGGLLSGKLGGGGGLLSSKLGAGGGRSGGLLGRLSGSSVKGSSGGREGILSARGNISSLAEKLAAKKAGKDGKGGLAKKVIKKDILYMMIVNLPSDAEV